MLRIDALEKRYGGTRALGPIGLTVGDGELTAVLGPSGSGKTTLLRLIAGLETPSAGSVTAGNAAGGSPPIGVVFQEPRLMPWLTVAENAGFGLHHLPAAERAERVAEALARVRLTPYADYLPKQLSGGMAQRAAIARALAPRPRALLLDEPFSALDPVTGAAMQDQLLEILDGTGSPVLFITHDIDEALALADRVVVIEGPPGRIRRDLAVDLPRPRNRRTPAFFALREHLHDCLDPEARLKEPDFAI